MAQKNFMRKCKQCQRKTMHLQQKPNHILHLLLTAFTLGLWIIPWVLISVFQAAPQCTECGKTAGLFWT